MDVAGFLSPASTTLCRRVGLSCALIAVSPLAFGAESARETDLIRASLEGGPGRARIEATRAQRLANGVASPILDNPSMEARHEQANGPAGASTDILSATVLLGIGGVADARGAELRGSAAGMWTHAALVSTICDTRRASLSAWLAEGRALEARTAQTRLETVLSTMKALAEIGELAPYDHERMSLTVATHQHAVDSSHDAHLAALAALSAKTGTVASSVTLLPLAPVPERSWWQDQARVADPIVNALQIERSAAEMALLAARRNALPNVSLSGGTRWDAMPDGTARTQGYEVGAALSLPIFDRNQPEIARRAADLVDIDAQLAERGAAVASALDAAWNRVEALGEAPLPLDMDAIWRGARSRYTAGVSTIDELLTVASDVEAAAVSRHEGEALRRAARLDLSCSVGVFPEPSIQAILEENAR